MTKEKLYEIIQSALNVESLSMSESMENLEEWDSLAQLEIIINIDKETDGKASRIPELAVANSVEKLSEILDSNNLFGA
jgi:acyl carrier protein